MLLPSGISFDDDDSAARRFRSLGNLVSPPTSPTATPFASLFQSCRALQSMLTTATQLPTPTSSPPLLNYPLPPPKFRLRTKARNLVPNTKPAPKMKLKTPIRSLTPTAQSMGSNKRRRSIDDVGGGRDAAVVDREDPVLAHDDGGRTDEDLASGNRMLDEGSAFDRIPSTPTNRSRIATEGAGSRNMFEDSIGDEDIPRTPKRTRMAPPSIPFGLISQDFYDNPPASDFDASRCRKSTSKRSTTKKHIYTKLPAPKFNHPNPTMNGNLPIRQQAFSQLQSSPFTFNIPQRSFSNPAAMTNPVSAATFKLPQRFYSNSAAMTNPFSPATLVSAPQTASPGASSVAAEPFEEEPQVANPDEEEQEGEEWSPEDDKLLVEVVLDKLKLSKEEWEECLANMGKGAKGKDRKQLSQRWSSLMSAGDIGVHKKHGNDGPPRRGLPATWGR